MIVHNVEQGSPEWISMRLGLLTASKVHRILKEDGKLRESQGVESFVDELLAEWLLGVPWQTGATAFMDRGSRMEQQARGWFEYEYLGGESIERVGFVTHDTLPVGCSPDIFRIGRTNRGAEIKIHGGKEHIGALRRSNKSHGPQVQCNIWLCERDAWDLVFWNPVLPSAVVTVVRDDAFIAAMEKSVVAFAERLQAAKDFLSQAGAKPGGHRCPDSTIDRRICQCPKCSAARSAA